MKEVLFVVLGNEPVLCRSSFFFKFIFRFLSWSCICNCFLLVVGGVLSVTSPPRGQDGDTTAAVDEVRNTWLTKTLE